jgi:2-C-methyl-D-erythritol 4-phosphate cytidylyltransferase
MLMNKENFTSLIFLAGGQGTRMGGNTPKQFRPLIRKPLALYSFEIFANLSEIDEIIVVCEPRFHSLFPSIPKPLHFVLPGNRRQDSVYNGLMAAADRADLICVHDSARPFVEKESILHLIQEARRNGAAALAVPAANTIKQADQCQCVQRTLPREELWELQTPQAIWRSLFLKAYAHAHQQKIEATDDLSLVEALGEKTYLIKGSPRNFKVTTPFDWVIAEKLCASN